MQKQFKQEKYKIKIYGVKHIRDVARFVNNNQSTKTSILSFICF